MIKVQEKHIVNRFSQIGLFSLKKRFAYFALKARNENPKRTPRAAAYSLFCAQSANKTSAFRA